MKLTKKGYIIDYDAEGDFIYFLPDRIWARILRTRICVNREKVRMIEILMIVDSDLRKKLKLKKQEDAISRLYKRKHIIIPPVGKERVTIGLCSFEGKYSRENIRKPLVKMLKQIIGADK